MTKVLIISSNMGRRVSNTVVKQEGVSADYICYNDTNFPTRSSSFTPRMTSKIPKMIGWMLNPGYDFYIWIDNYFNIKRPDAAAWFIQEINGHDILLLKNPYRNSIKKEAEFMHERISENASNFMDRIGGEPIMEQVETYFLDHTFTDNKLMAGGIFCYSSELVKNTEYNFMKEWFFHTCFYSIRDQLSLPYLLHKMKVNYKLSDYNYFNFPYAKYK